MSSNAQWGNDEGFTLPEVPPNTCIHAKNFSAWTEELFARVTRDPSIIGINQAKLLLLDKYFEWRSVVPKSHRNRLGGLGRHQCIFHVFEEAYERLKGIELGLMPPLLFVPSPPPTPSPPPVNQIAGIFLGELEKQTDVAEHNQSLHP